MGKKDYNIHTPEQEYEKELKRVQQFIRRAKKRGFIWDENPIPKRPKKITQKSVERLRQITPETLYQKAKHIAPETGELINTTSGKKIKQRGNKSGTVKTKNTQPYLPRESDIVLDTVRELIAQFQPPHYTKSLAELKTHHKNILEQILNSAISEYGENKVARRLQKEGASEIKEIVNAILYDSNTENVRHNLVRFATILKGSALTPDESIELAELSEYFESWEQPK